MKQESSTPWRITAQGVELFIHLQPRSVRDHIIGRYGQALKIAVTAPPVENAANIALCQFLATLLHLPRSSITLLSGAKSREKRLLLRTSTPELLQQKLATLFFQVDKKNPDG